MENVKPGSQWQPVVAKSVGLIDWPLKTHVCVVLGPPLSSLADPGVPSGDAPKPWKAHFFLKVFLCCPFYQDKEGTLDDPKQIHPFLFSASESWPRPIPGTTNHDFGSTGDFHSQTKPGQWSQRLWNFRVSWQVSETQCGNLRPETRRHLSICYYISNYEQFSFLKLGCSPKLVTGESQTGSQFISDTRIGRK